MQAGAHVKFEKNDNTCIRRTISVQYKKVQNQPCFRTFHGRARVCQKDTIPTATTRMGQQ